MLNKIILVARMTRDPELSYTQTGIAKAKFTLAVDRPYKNQQGEKQVDFIDVACWRQLAEIVAKHGFKGQMVAVVGRLEIRPYEGQDGQKKKITEVVADEVRFLSWKDQKGDTQSDMARAGFDMKGLDDGDLPW